MENKVTAKHVNDLIQIAKKSSEEAIASSSLVTRASKKVQDALQDTLGKTSHAAEVVAQKVKLNFKVFERQDIKTKVDEKDGKTLPTTVNWLVELFKDIIDKINDQGEILAFIVTKLGDLLDSDSNKEEMKQKQNDVEKHLTQRCEDLEKGCEELDSDAFKEEMKQKQTDLEKHLTMRCEELEKRCDVLEHTEVIPDLSAAKDEINQKHVELEKKIASKYDALDKKCDEVRQRGLKGNLIISSPERTTTRGQFIPSLAKHEMMWDRFGNWRCENDMEMVLRMVAMKTGAHIQECDVIACHPLGRREKNTFILSINNRAPMSSWEIITKGMMTADNNFSYDNVFINFQLTKRRGEISKEVRKAKKDNLIKSYETDANGRIYVKNLDNNFVEIIEIEDIMKYPGN